jgi:hypothetical protein
MSIITIIITITNPRRLHPPPSPPPAQHQFHLLHQLLFITPPPPQFLHQIPGTFYPLLILLLPTLTLPSLELAADHPEDSTPPWTSFHGFWRSLTSKEHPSCPVSQVLPDWSVTTQTHSPTQVKGYHHTSSTCNPITYRR